MTFNATGVKYAYSKSVFPTVIVVCPLLYNYAFSKILLRMSCLINSLDWILKETFTADHYIMCMCYKFQNQAWLSNHWNKIIKKKITSSVFCEIICCVFFTVRASELQCIINYLITSRNTANCLLLLSNELKFEIWKYIRRNYRLLIKRTYNTMSKKRKTKQTMIHKTLHGTPKEWATLNIRVPQH